MTLHLTVHSKGNFSLLPWPVEVVYASGIKVSLAQDTQENSVESILQ